MNQRDRELIRELIEAVQTVIGDLEYVGRNTGAADVEKMSTVFNARLTVEKAERHLLEDNDAV